MNGPSEASLLRINCIISFMDDLVLRCVLNIGKVSNEVLTKNDAMWAPTLEVFNLRSCCGAFLL